jgi:undecaprenyl-diphosphatase
MAFSFIYGGVFGNLILKNLVARPRPYSEIYPLQLRMFSESELLIEGLSDFSFPSGHTLIAFELAFVLVIMLRGIKEAISVFALIMASLIGFSRVYLYVHFPLDVLTGALLGCVFAILGVNTVKLIYKLIKPKSHQT